MSAKHATQSAKDAAMSAKDATMCAKDATMCAKDATMSGKHATVGANDATTSRATKIETDEKRSRVARKVRCAEKMFSTGITHDLPGTNFWGFLLIEKWGEPFGEN